MPPIRRRSKSLNPSLLTGPYYVPDEGMDSNPVSPNIQDPDDLEAITDNLITMKAGQLHDLALSSKPVLDAVLGHLRRNQALGERVAQLLVNYANLDVSDPEALARFVKSNVCEFEELGILRRSAFPRDENSAVGNLQAWKLLVDEILWTAEVNHAAAIAKWPSETRPSSLVEDPIICSILGHFFLGCLIHDDWDETNFCEKIMYLATRAGFSEQLRLFFNIGGPGHDVELERKIRVIGRHLLSMVHATYALTSGSQMPKKRKFFACRVVQALFGGDPTGAEVFAKKFMLIFGPTKAAENESLFSTSLDELAEREENLGTVPELRDAVVFNVRYGCGSYSSLETEAVIVELAESVKPVGWESQAEGVRLTAMDTVKDLHGLINALRGRLQLERKLYRTLVPETRRIVWFLTSYPKSWIQENTFAMLLMVGKTLTELYLVDRIVLKYTCFDGMTSMVLADYKIRFRRTDKAVQIIRNMCHRQELIQAFPRGQDVWKFAIKHITFLLTERAMELEKAKRKEGVTTNRIVHMTKDVMNISGALTAFVSEVSEALRDPMYDLH